jgi:hypothetical protein
VNSFAGMEPGDARPLIAPNEEGVAGQNLTLTDPATGQTAWQTPASGVTTHAALEGLDGDDHPQYLTEGRGDDRYAALGHGHQLDDVDGLIEEFAGIAAALSAVDDALAQKIAGSTGATTNRLVKSSGTGGKTIQATGITVDGSDNLTAPGTLHQFGPTNTTSDIRLGSAGIRGALFASLWQDYGFRRATDQLTIGGTWGAGFPTNWDPVHLFNTTGLNLTNSVGVRLHTGTLAGNLHVLQGHLRATGTKTITLDDGQSGAVTFVVNGMVRVGQYTDATLPTAGTAGRIAYSSDSGLVHDNGTNWRKATHSNV